ncbi:MAG: MFS transporter [Trueperaceae bacterium]
MAHSTTNLKTANRNFWYGVFNGILINVSETFFSSGLVLAPFLAALGASPIVIGLVPALRVGGWFLPQLLVAQRLASEPYKLPSYRRIAWVRGLAFFLLSVATFVIPNYQVLVVTIIVLLTVVAFSGGVSGVAFTDVTAKIVPHSRLGTFWVLRNAGGGLLALGGGLLLRWVLSSEIPFPYNFGILLTIGTALAAVAYWIFGLIDEPPGKPSTKASLGQTIKNIPQLLREHSSFRRYLRVRSLVLIALLADPFYAIYAQQRLRAPESELGTFIIVTTLASIIANFAFRRPANQGRNVLVLQIGMGFLVLASLLALFAPSWQWINAVLVASATGQAAVNISVWNLLFAVAPDAERAMYTGVTNTLMALPSFAPILAGVIVTFLGYPGIFIVALTSGVVALAFSFRFADLKALDSRLARG